MTSRAAASNVGLLWVGTMNPIQVHFTLTAADFDEWSKAITFVKPGKTGSTSKVRQSLIGWLLFIALSVLMVMLLNNNASVPQRGSVASQPVQTSKSLSDVISPFIPWLVIFGFIWFFVYRQLRARGRRIWDANEDLRQPHIAVFDYDAVTITGPKVSARMLWSAFDAWLETPNLFLLRQSVNDMYQLIPKHAVPADRLGELRALLAARIGVAAAP